MALQIKSNPITFAEAITTIVVTPSTPGNLLNDWDAKYDVHPIRVTNSKKQLPVKPTKKQLKRAHQFQRRTQ